jgi:DNA polymerase V
MGKQRQHYYAYRYNPIGDSALIELKEKLKINPRYIMYGEEPILLTDNNEYASSVDKNAFNAGTEQFQALKNIANNEYGSLAKLAKALGKDVSYLYTYRHKKMGIQLINELKDIGIDVEYITVEEKSIEKNPKPEQTNKLESVQSLKPLGCFSIPFKVINVNAVGGFTYSESPHGYLDTTQVLTDGKNNITVAIVNGNSLIGFGIFSGDTLIIEETTIVHNKQIIICSLNGVSIAKRYEIRADGIFLTSDNSHNKEIKINNADVFIIYGVAIKVIHNL